MFKKILTKYLLIWLVLVCLLAFFWSNIFGADFFNPFFLKDEKARGNLMSATISLTMLAVGSLLPFEEVKAVAKRWYKTLGGTCVQYLSMPLLAWGVAKILHLEGAAFIGVVMAGCVPGAMASNVLTMTAKGNVSYSVGLTTLATLCSPIVVPATLEFFLEGSQIDFPAQKVMISLLETVVAPVIIGFTLARCFGWWRKLANTSAEIVANLAIIWIIAAVVSQNAANVSKTSSALLGAMLLLNVLGYLAGYLGGTALRLDAPMRRALTIEVGMQNAGLGTVLAMKYFPDQPEAALFCASYTFGCMFTGIILAQSFRFAAEHAEKKAEEENAESKEGA